MTVSLLSSCSDGCGWMAAVICVLTYGSFGVPIKTGVNVEVDPIIMQTYKTIVLFSTSWLVLLLGEEVQWSNWGILSGLFWVPGATCGIYGIRNAGLAIAVGTWSSIIVLTSFIFGIVIFEEKVKSIYDTTLAFMVLVLGLIGMSRYAAPTTPSSSGLKKEKTEIVDDDYETDSGVVTASLRTDEEGHVSTRHQTKTTNATEDDSTKQTSGNAASSKSSNEKRSSALEIEPLLKNADDDTPDKRHVIFFGGRLALTKRQLGVLGAVINGGWGGLSLIPVHYARRDSGLSGAAFVISYAGGSLIVQTIIWIILFLYQLYQKKFKLHDAIDSLPKFHLKQLWRAGLCAGLLYSIGNFASILAVTYLGQGIGFSFCQLQLLVSGLWGVFYFREIRDSEAILKWFCSAGIAVIGIIWLSYQHEGSASLH